MKRVLFALLGIGFLALSIPAQAQAQPSLPDTLRYQQVVAVAGASADVLYARAREWAALTFEDAHQAVQFDDPQRHLLLGGGYTHLLARRPNGNVREVTNLWFRFRIEAREGRYRVEIYNLGSGYPFSNSVNLNFASYELRRWLTSGYATQAATERHNALSVGFADAALYPEGQTSGQLKKALDEAVEKLLVSLRKTETATPAAW